MFRTTTTAVTIFAVSTLMLGCETEEPITPEEAATFAEKWAPTLEPTLLERTERFLQAQVAAFHAFHKGLEFAQRLFE